MEWGRYCFTDFKKITICRSGSSDHSVALPISVMSGLLFVCVLSTCYLSSSWTLRPWYAYGIILFDLYQKYVECLQQHTRDNHYCQRTSQRLDDFSLDISKKGKSCVLPELRVVMLEWKNGASWKKEKLGLFVSVATSLAQIWRRSPRLCDAFIKTRARWEYRGRGGRNNTKEK